jgi:hypothetical protein
VLAAKGEKCCAVLYCKYHLLSVLRQPPDLYLYLYHTCLCHTYRMYTFLNILMSMLGRGSMSMLLFGSELLQTNKGPGADVRY